MESKSVELKEEVEMLKKYYGFSDDNIKRLEERNELGKAIERIKLGHFLHCRGGRDAIY